MSQLEVRPELPEGYRIYKMEEGWYIPEKHDKERSMWRSYSKGRNGYYWHKTWNGAYRFIMRKHAEKLAREEQ